MGVKGFFYMIKKHFKYSHTTLPFYDYLFIDGNCILHYCIESFENAIPFCLNEVIEAIIKKMEELINKYSIKKKVYIVFDGIPPLPKQYCQKVRRENSDKLSIFLLPGTKMMREIESKIVSYFKSDFIEIVESDKDGEGEQKIFLILKEIYVPGETSLILSVDSDVIILAYILLSDPMFNHKIFVESSGFKITVNVNSLKLVLPINDLLLFCVLCGNDFFPKLEELKSFTTTQNMKILKMVVESNNKIFEDISEGICVLNCDNTKVLNYLNLIRWYKEYFTTNISKPCLPYDYEISPCCYCISTKIKSLKDNNEEVNLDIPEIQNYLQYVLQPNQMSNIYC
uniref:Xrn1 N-terminal domain-containing protein n=1 Tax=viral metagenome TaxID=1070528 RepID=A0A6C0JPM8_9ZZZZ